MIAAVTSSQDWSASLARVIVVWPYCWLSFSIAGALLCLCLVKRKKGAIAMMHTKYCTVKAINELQREYGNVSSQHHNNIRLCFCSIPFFNKLRRHCGSHHIPSNCLHLYPCIYIYIVLPQFSTSSLKSVFILSYTPEIISSTSWGSTTPLEVMNFVIRSPSRGKGWGGFLSIHNSKQMA